MDEPRRPLIDEHQRRYGLVPATKRAERDSRRQARATKSGDTTLTRVSVQGGGSGGSAGATALDDLTDVNAPTPSDGDALTWDSATGKWINAAPTGGSGFPNAADIWIQMPMA